MSDKQSDIGLIGLAVMGQNLALNIADHGYRVSVYNRTASKTEAFVLTRSPGLETEKPKRRKIGTEKEEIKGGIQSKG